MPSTNTSINDVVDVLLNISRQLDVATGLNSQYAQDNKQQEEEKVEQVVRPTLTSDEKKRYANIARQFEVVLGVGALRHTLQALNSTLTDQQKAASNAERASHIARHRAVATTAPTNQPTTSPGMLSGMGSWIKSLGLGALLSLVGGIGIVASTMMQVGPLYGILQNVAKYASLTGMKGIVVAAGKFLRVLTAPFQMLSHLFTGKSLGKLVEGGAMKLGGKFLLEKFPTIFKFLGKGLKFLKPIPILGSLISFYFAWDRFKKGDVTGGIIDVISGIASLFPGVGTALSIGLDMINLYRDLSGKSAQEAAVQSPSKTWLKDKMNKLGEFVSTTCYDWPIIGPLIRAYEHFKADNWIQGINSLVHFIPAIGWIADFFVKEQDPRTGQQYTGKSFTDVIKQAWRSSVDLMKNIPIIGNLLTAVDYFIDGKFDLGLQALDGIIPGIGNVIKFLTPSTETQQQLKTLATAVGTNVKSFATWTLEKLGLGWLLDGTSDSLFDAESSKLVVSFIKDKVSELYGKIKDFFTSMVSSAGDILKNLMGSDGDFSMQFINVLTKIKPSIDKASREIQLTFTSSLKEQLNALAQIEAILFMQKEILEDNRALLREIVTNTRNTISSSPMTSNYNGLSPVTREERSFTRRSYINDVRSMNAVVRESLA